MIGRLVRIVTPLKDRKAIAGGLIAGGFWGYCWADR